MGHVRDLPESAADIPAKYKKEEWARIGVNVDEGFEPLYVVPKRKSKIISELKKKLQGADELYLATDEDREGESIAWHLLEVLKPKIPVKRMVFHEITKKAIEKALTQTRMVDEKLVRAQETRRILDRLYGYTLSPLIWKKIAFGLSAGRVQSVALKLIVERERARARFKKAEYWDLKAQLEAKASKGQSFEARLTAIKGVKLATGKDFDENTGLLSVGTKEGRDVLILNEAQAAKARDLLRSANFKVTQIQEKPGTSRPAPPFITSTLQQEGNRKLGLSAKDTMRIAQSLYEEGLITYMRTDSPSLSTEAIAAARREVETLYGKEYLSPEPRQYSAKSKGAQEAHEAIRPSGSDFVHPKSSGLSGRELALYELIWKRTMATQMAEAKKLSVAVQIDAEGHNFQANGSRILFPGFLRAYVEGSDDPEAALEDREVLLPEMKEGELVKLNDISADQHETKPPARFTEASLVQMLEKEGVGRPSTYASIIGTIQDRGYVRKQAAALVPTFTGFAVSQFMERNFANLVDTKFTSKMEESLDEIAEGTIQWLPYLKEFYSSKQGLASQVKAQEKNIDPDESRTVTLENIKSALVKVGRFGPYIVKVGARNEDARASIPEDYAPADLKDENVQDLIDMSAKGPQAIGVHPGTGENIYCLIGRFGPYVQQGEIVEGGAKPRRASLPKGVDPKAVTMEQALQWLSLPRDLGAHPKTSKPIITNNGRFGPYVMHDGEFRSLKKTDDVYTITLERAVELINEPKKSRVSTATVLKDLGKHPKDSKPVQILDGKYGAYVKHGAKNATLPKDTVPANITMDEALKVLAARKSKR